jgi:deoxyhypusine synthase
MNSPPQARPPWRVPRVHLESNTPAVLRFPTGQRIGASLQVVSLTGGLLSVPQALIQGSQVKLMFLTGGGSVLGAAEMLRPISDALQPFRFVSLAADDHRRLGTLIWQHSSQNKFDEVWIEKLRAASAQQTENLRWRFGRTEAFGLLTLGLAAAAYLLNPGLLK